MLASNQLAQRLLHFTKIGLVNMPGWRLLSWELLTVLVLHCLGQQGQSREVLGATIVQIIFTVS